MEYVIHRCLFPFILMTYYITLFLSLYHRISLYVSIFYLDKRDAFPLNRNYIVKGRLAYDYKKSKYRLFKKFYFLNNQRSKVMEARSRIFGIFKLNITDGEMKMFFFLQCCN